MKKVENKILITYSIFIITIIHFGCASNLSIIKPLKNKINYTSIIFYENPTSIREKIMRDRYTIIDSDSHWKVFSRMYSSKQYVLWFKIFGELEIILEQELEKKGFLVLNGNRNEDVFAKESGLLLEYDYKLVLPAGSFAEDGYVYEKDLAEFIIEAKYMDIKSREELSVIKVKAEENPDSYGWEKTNKNALECIGKEISKYTKKYFGPTNK